jgi:hypothetical protein
MIGNRTKLILGSLGAVFVVPAILGFVCNRVCSDYRAIGGLIREGSVLIPAAVSRLHFSALLEIMLLCVIIAIGGVVAGLIISRKPLSALKLNNKTNYSINRE